MKKTNRALGLFLFWFVCTSLTAIVWCQQETNKIGPVFSCEKMDHDFGRVREVDGYAVHEFYVHNTGDAPLVISQVLTTCGCAQPEWSKTPIEPGATGYVIVSYDMVNRPGPFMKKITAFTNEKTLRRVFTIQGDVIPKPQTLHVLFKDTIGTVQMEQATFHFNAVRPHETPDTEIWIQNFSQEEIKLTVDNIPDFLNVTVPDRLESNYPDRMTVAIDSSMVDANFRGRKYAQLTWTTESTSGEKTTKTIPVSANFIDDFRRLTPAERAEGPSMQISAKTLEFGKLKKKRVFKELTISNTGQSPLTLHSISIDSSKDTEITGFNKSMLQPDESLKIKIFVNPKDIKGVFSTNLIIVNNDPQRPVQQVRIVAEK